MVIRVDGGAAGCLAPWSLGAGVADTDDQDLRPQGLEVMPLFQVGLELADHLFLDVQHSPADLAHRMVVIAGGELVVGGALIEVRGVDRARCREGIERSIHSAAWKSRLVFVYLGRDLLSGAVPAERDHRVVDLCPLCGAAHARGEHQRSLITRSERSAWVSNLQPERSTTTSSSIRTPPQPGM